MQSRPVTHLLAVFAGGIVGGGLRLALDVLLPHTDAQFPLSTLLINIGGSFALGILTSGLFARRMSSIARAALGPGLLGSFTTFSAVSLAVVLLGAAEPPRLPLAAGYLLLTLGLGFGAAFLGLRLGRPAAHARPTTNPETGE